jgi:hypothetical protein
VRCARCERATCLRATCSCERAVCDVLRARAMCGVRTCSCDVRGSACTPAHVCTSARKHVARKHVAREHVAREHVARKHVARKHVARKHVARKHVARKHVAREHVAREHVAREHVAREHVAHRTSARPHVTHYRHLFVISTKSGSGSRAITLRSFTSNVGCAPTMQVSRSTACAISGSCWRGVIT